MSDFHGADHLRIGDAERDTMVAALHEHFAQGRLTVEELDERLSAALTARTHGDLRRIDHDLPGPVLEPVRHRPRFRRGPPFLLKLALVGLIISAVPGAGAAVLATFHLLLLFSVLALVFAVRRFAARRHHRRRLVTEDYGDRFSGRPSRHSPPRGSRSWAGPGRTG